jgi:hypothetical protein
MYETSGDDEEPLPDGREFGRPRSTVLMGRGRKRAVSIARDQLAVITYSYDDGFSGFLSWGLPTLREGLQDLDVGRVLGVAYRYENRIQQATRSFDLGSLLTISLSPPTEVEKETRNVHLYWHQRWPQGEVEVDINACPHVSAEEVHLNITAYIAAPSGAVGDIETLVREAHRRARLTFEALITPSFRDHLRTART